MLVITLQCWSEDRTFPEGNLYMLYVILEWSQLSYSLGTIVSWQRFAEKPQRNRDCNELADKGFRSLHHIKPNAWKMSIWCWVTSPGTRIRSDRQWCPNNDHDVSHVSRSSSGNKQSWRRWYRMIRACELLAAVGRNFRPDGEFYKKSAYYAVYVSVRFYY